MSPGPTAIVNSEDASVATRVEVAFAQFWRQYRTFLDLLTPRIAERWTFSILLLVLTTVRFFVVHGWYIVCYALYIYLLNMLLAFLTPKFDPSGLSNDGDLGDDDDGITLGSGGGGSFASSPSPSPSGGGGMLGDGLLPTRTDDEFRPFVRRLPEFKFWYGMTKATVIALVCTFFKFLDIPVFWPILVVYFIVLFVLTMRRQIQHMIRHKYVPFDLGKKKYGGGR
ncbi:retrieval of early ER protein Rer1 [Ramicandelaber brevisporus]|nr:retrieval of early ER protein Rer1 [Ramicandelaber brevisporus]